MTKEQWQQTLQVMTDQGALNSAPPVDGVFTDAFMKAGDAAARRRVSVSPRRRQGGSLMFETAVLGLGTMGPGIAARLARGE